jgi:hypothetical protein
MRDYFTAEGVALSEVDGFILERFSSLKAEPQEACEWASCKEVEL